MTDLKMGDRVTYKGEEWEVGFVNQISFRGTLRLQKSGLCDARQVNRVYPEEVIKIESIKSKERHRAK